MMHLRSQRLTTEVLLPIAVLLVVTGSVFADEVADPDELLPGLVARYSAGGRSLEQIDRDVQFVWRGAPDERLPAVPFEGRWTGRLQIRTDEQYRFHLYLAGEASVSVSGRVVVQGRRESPGWVSGEAVPLAGDELPIEVTYRETGATGTLRLFWSGESFPVEPIPPQALFHAGARPELARLQRGKDLYAAHRCNRCHARENEEPAAEAPALKWAASGLARDWLAAWLVNPAKQSPHARMPAFGFSEQEARTAAAYLAAQAAPFDARALEIVERPAAARRGEILFRSVGCLACHTHGELGTDTPYSGGDLTNIGGKRSERWLFDWLANPEQLNPAHRMPVFRLSDDERTDLVAYLSGSVNAAGAAAEKGVPPDAQTLAAGQKLVADARCVACHHDTEAPLDRGNLPRLDRRVADWSRACSEGTPDRGKWRPAYQLIEADRLALRAYVESRYGTLSPRPAVDTAKLVLRQHNCLNCHERDGARGIAAIAARVAALDPDLKGQSEAMMPPDLTAAGDKLLDDFLTAAVTGGQKQFRMPWLRVRMPRFPQGRFDAAALAGHLIDHDRIPDAAPTPRVDTASSATATDAAEERRIGALLAGTRGFSCVACHQVGQFEPRNVDIATRGSDLFGMQSRMRPEYFRRWVRSPLRIIPNMEMPSFNRPLPDLLGGNIDRQLAALWAALTDRRAPQVDTSTIEQTVAVAPGAPAAIIHDVFNVGDGLNPQFIARSFAVGFENGANVLFDADTMSLRGRWAGTFAQHRASGKSWFWEPGSSHRLAADRGGPDVALRPADRPDAAFVSAERLDGRFGRLTKYASDGTGVRLHYQLTFKLPERTAVVSVSESWTPKSNYGQPGQVGVLRTFAVDNVPAGFDVVVREPRESETQADSIVRLETNRQTVQARGAVGSAGMALEQKPAASPAPVLTLASEPVTAVPGYDGVRLALPWTVMPTAITWLPDGTLAFCSLRGSVFLVRDSDGDGLEDKVTEFEAGLSAPFGLIADGNDLIVAHKPEVLRLRDTDGDGRADVREVVADGWGFTEDYHDWTAGIVRDSRGNLYVGTGSDYAKRGRDRDQGKWRGKILRIDRAGGIEVLAHELRYPTGLAIAPDDQVFISDQQGVQNPFNEINHLVAGAHYGVPALYEEKHEGPPLLPAVRIPHPWTRSVSGIFFLPRDARTPEPGRAPGAEAFGRSSPFAGHGIGCEFNNRFLMRFTLQRVGETYQGAAYALSEPPGTNTSGQFLGTLCGAVSPKGDIYIGSIYDSGWLGGANIGDIVRLRPNGKLPVGIREIRAEEGLFEIAFTDAIDRDAASRPGNYDISGYTRIWQGTYATPDSGLHQLPVRSVDVRPDGRSVVLHVDRQQAGHVYEIRCGRIGPPAQPALWPGSGSYSMNVVPPREKR